MCLLLIGILAINLSCTTQAPKENLKYPQTAKVDTVDTYFGVDVPDPYRWLEDDMSDETAEWVTQQNDVTQSYLYQIPFREKIKERLEKLYNYERVYAPTKHGDYEYYFRNDGLQNQNVLFRRSSEGDDEVFLDPNTFSEDGTVSLATTSFTKDGSLIGFLISIGGSDWRKAIIMNTETKEVVEDTLQNIKFSGLRWKGNDGFYYSSYDKPKEGSELSAKTQIHKLYYHKLGTSQDEDQLVFGGEENPYRYIFGYLTEDERFLVANAAQSTSGNVLFVKDLQSGGDFVEIDGDMETDEFVLHNQGTDLFLQTNLDAPNQRVVKVDFNSPAQSGWVDIIPETENVLTSGTAGGYLFASYLKDAKTEVVQFDMEGKKVRDVQLPAIGTARGFGGDEDDESLYYSFTSFTYPSSIYKFDIGTGTSELYTQPKVDFDPEAYETKQVFYESKDGTKVPMFIVHKKGLELNGNNPTYLYAYGGFNISLRPGFNTGRVHWLENGGIYAQPNLRGGGEYGEAWHKAGTKMQKQNVFDDFIAAAEWLIENNYTSSDKLAIAGGSNGGLLVGATMTQRPDLAKVAFPAVGVMDMLRYHKFTAGAGWASDYGTSEDSKEMFDYLKGYSPVHNLNAGTSYPATMVTTADHDDRVVPAHSFKFAATLQESHEGPNPVLIRIETDAGHGAGTPISKRLEQLADIYSFAWYNMGVVPELAKSEL